MQKIHSGYYIKARKIKDSKIITSPPYVREIWDWLLREASPSDGRHYNYEIKRGQLFKSYKEIREGLAWYVGYRKLMYTENQIKKAMKALREYRMIASTREPEGVLITICNYDFYQNIGNYERTYEEPTKAPTKAQEKRTLNIKKTNGETTNNKDYLSFEKEIISLWNSFCAKYPILSEVKEISERRRIHLKQRFMKASFRDFKQILKALSEQPFCLGKNKYKWKVSFDWIIGNDTNYIKIIERSYASEKSNASIFRD